MTISDFVTVEWAPASDPTSLSPSWVDITSVVQEVTVTGGRSGVFDLYGPRTATIKARNGIGSTGQPNYEAATWDVAGFYRWRQIRVTTASSAAVFTGYILSVTHDQTNSPWVGEVTIECTDIMGILAQAEFTATDNIGNTRRNRLRDVNMLTECVIQGLGFTGVDTSIAAVAAGSTAYYKLPDAPSGQILSWLQSLMEGEAAGGIQIAADGLVIVHGRWWNFALGAASFTFSDTPGVGEFKYLRENLTFASTDSDYYNRAVAKTAYHDETFTVENVPAGFPKETLSRTDLPFVYETWAEANARMYSKLYSTPFTYPRSLKVFVASTGTQNPDDLGGLAYLFGENWVAIKHTPTGDTQQTYNVTIESVVHTITPSVWTYELGFASLDRWLTAYGDGTTISPLVLIGGDASNGIGSDAIIAP